MLKRPDITLDYRITDFFFDRIEIIEAIEKAERKNLSQIGAFIRKRARSNLRRRKKTSQPGNTPSVHSRDRVATLKNILFGYEPSRHSVVIGPVGLNQANYLQGGGRTTVPQLHEFGGSILIHEERLKKNRGDGHWYRRDLRSKRELPWKDYRLRLATYEARPFMGPALDEETAAGTITDVWRASIGY
tara:strand:- start:2719 stop:3282 length:564 start_codon:yes stop_codon:yes gene_type:complete